MTRVTRGFVAKKRRKKVLQLASGFTGANNRLYRTAQQRTLRALSTAYRDRRLMKRTIRSVWIRRINCFLRDLEYARLNLQDSALVISGHASNLSDMRSVRSTSRFVYSAFTSELKRNKILLNRKILSQLAIFDPTSMQKIIQNLQNSNIGG